MAFEVSNCNPCFSLNYILPTCSSCELSDYPLSGRVSNIIPWRDSFIISGIAASAICTFASFFAGQMLLFSALVLSTATHSIAFYYMKQFEPLQDLIEVADNLRHFNGDLLQRNQELRQTGQRLREEVQTLGRHNDNLQKTNTQLRQNVEEMQQEVRNLHEEIHILHNANTMLQEIRQSIHEETNQLNIVRGQFQVIQQQLHEETQQLNQIRERLREEVNRLSSMRSN